MSALFWWRPDQVGTYFYLLFYFLAGCIFLISFWCTVNSTLCHYDFDVIH